MSLLSAIDNIYAFRLSRLLLTDWKKWDAFKLGLIDENGERIKEKKLSTPKERASWNYFIRAAARLKRLLEKVPGGKTKVVQALAIYKLVVSEKTEPAQIEQQVLLYAEELVEAMVVGSLGDGDGIIGDTGGSFAADVPATLGEPKKKKKKKLKRFSELNDET